MAISLPSDRMCGIWDINSESGRVKYRLHPGGVASRLSIIMYAAMVMPILCDNSYSPNNSNWLFKNRQTLALKY